MLCIVKMHKTNETQIENRNTIVYFNDSIVSVQSWRVAHVAQPFLVL